MARSYRYLLGDSGGEAARLRAQARLWDPVSHALFDRIGVKKGWRVLEIGPGQGSLHLELRRRVRGPIDAVERSPVFAEHLARINTRDGHGSGRIWSWVTTYFLGVMERLGKLRPFTPEKARAMSRFWRAAAKERSSLLIAPAVLDVVGRKGRRAWSATCRSAWARASPPRSRSRSRS